MNDIDWNFWLNMPTVKIWQACALSLNIDPDKMKQHPDGYMSPSGFLFKDESFQTLAKKDNFNKRLRLLSTHVINNQNIHIASVNSKTPASEIYLKSFVSWSLDIVHWEIPNELVTLIKEKREVQFQERSVTQDSQLHENVLLEHSEREEIYSLFDPMKRAAITALFNKFSEEEWKEHFDRASRNKLDKARESKTKPYKYNPARIADWLVDKGIYTKEQVDRKLANNLPERSKDKKYLITGELD